MIPFEIILPQGGQVFKTQQYEIKSPIVYPQITQITQRAQRIKKGIMGEWNIGMMGKKIEALKAIIPLFQYSNSYALYYCCVKSLIFVKIFS